MSPDEHEQQSDTVDQSTVPGGTKSAEPAGESRSLGERRETDCSRARLDSLTRDWRAERLKHARIIGKDE
jgi:hypothetical protein